MYMQYLAHFLSLLSFSSVGENRDLPVVLETGTTNQAAVLSHIFAAGKYTDQHLDKVHKMKKLHYDYRFIYKGTYFSILERQLGTL